MNVHVLISGNLTGFSRFYASPGAHTLYDEGNLDVDYRNFLTFLNPGEKAYAISFAPKKIAVSLVTRILDSFHRPGILVVTALIPRNQLVKDTSNVKGSEALYNLLNEINDRFYEKNFLNGMVNQNPSVLVQDIYADITSRYSLVAAGRHKPINATIDTTAFAKRVGYVAANEKDMPEYLSSLLRKSYEGYHHVFFAERAPQNIDEPAEEVVTYKVRVENGNRPVPGEVRLTDRIVNVAPDQGEIDLPNKNFTYQQVLAGEAAPAISAMIENGETIVLTFRFPKEEKTLHFKFYEGYNEVPVALLRPLIVDNDGTVLPLSSDSFKFIGKEIQGIKTIKVANEEFILDAATAHLDLQRWQDGATMNVYVKRGWQLMYTFRNANKPKTIKLINRFTDEHLQFDHVTDSVQAFVPGKKSEWEMEITSDYYEPVSVPATTESFKLLPKTHPMTVADSFSGRPAAPLRPNSESPKATQELELDSSQEEATYEEEPTGIWALFPFVTPEMRKNVIYGAAGIGALVVCLVVILVHWHNTKNREITDIGNQINTEMTVKNVKFIPRDDSNNNWTISPENLKLLTISVEATDGKDITIDQGQNGQFSKSVSFNPKNSNDSILIEVLLNDIYSRGKTIILASEKRAVGDLKDEEEITLSVKNSVLSSLYTLQDSHKLSTNEKETLDKQINLLSAPNSPEGNKEFAKLLIELRDKQGEQSNLSNPRPSDNQNQQTAQPDGKKTDKETPRFDLSWTLAYVRNLKTKDIYKDYKDELDAIEACLKGLYEVNKNEVVKVEIKTALPENYKTIAKKLEEVLNQIDGEIQDKGIKNNLKKNLGKDLMSKPKDLQSIHKAQDVLTKDNPKIINAIKKQKKHEEDT